MPFQLTEDEALLAIEATSQDCVYVPLMEDVWEFEPDSVRVLEESESPLPGGGKRYMIEGKCQQIGKRNKNGRKYPEPVIRKKIVENADVQAAIRGRRLFGACDHPEKGSTKLVEVSHMITGLRLNESDGSVWGQFHVFDTPRGRIIKTIIDEGGVPGFSSRGAGSVNKITNEVQEDYKFKTIDIVADPSTEGADAHKMQDTGALPLQRGAVRLAADVNVSQEELDKALAESRAFLSQAYAFRDYDPITKIELITRLAGHEELVERCASSRGSLNEVQSLLAESRGFRQALEGSIVWLLEDTSVPSQALTEESGGPPMSMGTTPIPTHTMNLSETIKEAQRTAVLDRDNQILNASMEELQEAYKKLKTRYDASQKVVSEMTERYHELAAKSQGDVNRLQVAEGIIEALAEKYENLQKQILEESGSGQEQEAREKASVSIIEAAVRRIRAMEAIIEELGRRVVAGEKLCEAMAVQIRNSILINEMENMLSGVSDPEKSKRIRSVLERATTVTEMRESFEVFASVLNESAQVQPSQEQQMQQLQQQQQQQVHQLQEQHRQQTQQLQLNRAPLPNPQLIEQQRQQLQEQAKGQQTAPNGSESQVSMALLLEQKLRSGSTKVNLNG